MKAEGRDCSRATGFVKQAKTWMAQILYHVPVKLCKQLVLWGHLDREHKVALQHRPLGEMQSGKSCLFTADKLAWGNRKE